MKQSRHVYAALIVLALGSWATLAAACGEDKTKASAAAASSDHSGCTAAMAAQCTPEMAAACKAGKTKSATTAKSRTRGNTVTNVTVSNIGGVPASTYDAVLVGSGAGCNHGAASATAVTAGAGGQCSGHGAAKTAGGYSHADCDACADMAFCDGEVKALGATVQVVPLKNGVMYVYTALDANKVHAVQASMGRRNDRMVNMLTAGDKAHLCPSCKAVRGAIASGKMNRELVNIEGGCLTLMTSNDPITLSKIYSLAGLKGPMSVKS